MVEVRDIDAFAATDDLPKMSDLNEILVQR